MLGIAWKIQENAYGGLSAATRRRLADLSNAMEKKGDVIRRRVAIGKEGLGFVGNLFVGVAGALLAGVLTDHFNVDLGLPTITIELEEVALAAAGAFLLLVFVWLVKKQQSRKEN